MNLVVESVRRGWRPLSVVAALVVAVLVGLIGGSMLVLLVALVAAAVAYPHALLAGLRAILPGVGRRG